jgi:Histidine kinase-, DNA gyrase B-, and HSP90-like ATPase
MAKGKTSAAAPQQRLFTSHYEEDFLVRTLGDLVRRPEVALGELVANAWDAGAARVEVSIPANHDEELVVEDDGCGLTKEQFDQRWMTLGYNRQKSQGSEVEFPPGRQGRRRAYGRNGQGRHGLLCFAKGYEVTTTRDGRISVFQVRAANGEHPFVSSLVSDRKGDGHGTRLSVRVQQNLPGPDRIRELLSAKFLHDPEFTVSVNGETLPMTSLPGFAGEVRLEAKDPESSRVVRMTLELFEGEAGRAKHQSGVAFWVGSRLVGEAGWKVMGEPILDGRTRPGRRLTIVVKSDDLLEDVLPDWTDFRHSALTEEVGLVVSKAVVESLSKLYSERVRETTAEVLNNFKPEMESLERGEREEVAEVAQSIAKADPLVAPAVLSAAVGGVIEAKKNASVQLLMRRIEALPADDINGLHRLLDEWRVRDALTVLDEIGRRIKVIEAMQKLMGDPSVDELHVLHPLVTQARWLFGPEYDSPQYSANLGLRHAMAKVFKVDAPGSAFKNPQKRPDLLVRADSTVAAVASEDISIETNVATCRRILLVELKKGDFRIGRKEMDQASGYVEDLLNSGHLTGTPFVHAFVVGHELDPQTTNVRKVGESPERGRIEAQTFAQLVSTANARLFRIRDQVEDRYPVGADGMLSHLKQDTTAANQLGISFPKSSSSDAT